MEKNPIAIRNIAREEMAKELLDYIDFNEDQTAEDLYLEITNYIREQYLFESDYTNHYKPKTNNK